ncbi:MAG: aminotransferase class V-fold PLP-dependent enzyme [Oscillospiraceae bacterium]|nr:aminotransferase class V-fold PLP-dependent enzyme [Oscillospiraceae bacterium]
MIYLDNAATTLIKPDCVAEAVINALSSMGNSGRGVHGNSLSASRVIYDTRAALAALFNAPSPARVAFTSNSTEALNTAIFGLFQAGDHVISTDWEHNSVLRPLYAVQQQGVEVDFVPADTQGRINYDDFDKLLRSNTRAIVCTHASNLTGDVLDIARIGRFAHEHGLLFIVDASQTAGALPIDMAAMHIDILCFTGHKSLMGPQGTGGLCLAEGLELRPLKTGGTGVQTYLPHQPAEMPAHLEAGTLNGHGIAGLGAALEFINAVGISAIHEHEMMLMHRFYEGVKDLDGVTVYGDFTCDRAPIVTLNIGDMPSGELADILSGEFSIATRAGAHCAPRLHQALGTVEQGAVRFSFGYFNTVEDVDAAIAALRSVAL